MPNYENRVLKESSSAFPPFLLHGRIVNIGWFHTPCSFNYCPVLTKDVSFGVKNRFFDISEEQGLYPRTLALPIRASL